MTHLVVLIRRHSYKLGLGEHVRPEGAVGKLQDVVGPHYVEPGLVLVHGVQDRLDQHTQKAQLWSEYRGVFACPSLIPKLDTRQNLLQGGSSSALLLMLL